MPTRGNHLSNSATIHQNRVQTTSSMVSEHACGAPQKRTRHHRVTTVSHQRNGIDGRHTSHSLSGSQKRTSYQLTSRNSEPAGNIRHLLGRHSTERSDQLRSIASGYSGFTQTPGRSSFRQSTLSSHEKRMANARSPFVIGQSWHSADSLPSGRTRQNTMTRTAFGSLGKETHTHRRR